jgi:acyl carrier protein
MTNISSIRDRVKAVIVKNLELPILPAGIGDNTALFAPGLVGGLELDSLAAIEIVVGLSREFRINLDEIPKESFLNVSSLADYIAKKLETAATDDPTEPK